MSENGVRVISTESGKRWKDGKVSIIVDSEGLAEQVEIEQSLFESLFGMKPESQLIVWYKILRTEVIGKE